MQLMSCDFAGVARPPGQAALAVPRRSLTNASLNKKPVSWSPPRSTAALRPAASRRDDAEFGCAGGGRQVDEGMAVLRRRINDMRAAESVSWEEEPASPWWTTTAGEKKELMYGSYDDVCELVDALQAFLVGAPPGVAVGLAVALVLAVPASAFVLASHLLDASRALLSNLPH